MNNKVFDFKLKQKITSFFQFKTQKYSLFNNSQFIIYNVGINTIDDNYRYKYTMIIDDNAIKFKAEKFQEDKLIEHKLINLG